MKVDHTPVKSDAKLLGEVDFPVFETVDEALNHPTYGLGEVKVL